MRPIHSLLMLVVLACLAVHSRVPAEDLVIRQASTTNPWTHLKVNNDPANFQFAIVSDRTGGHRAGVFEDAIRKLNMLQPEFVMSVGDLIEGYSQDEREVDQQWNEVQSFIARLQMPFFYVPGNHDISNPMQARKWEQRFGRSYYHFVYRNVLFLCLNTEDPPPSHISGEQVEYVKQALEENKNVRWTLVFMHKPLWRIEELGWTKVEALFQGRPYTVIAGHTHNYLKFEWQDHRYIILATTGGDSRLRGPYFGELDHVAWVTMTDQGPILANLMPSGIWDENIRTEESWSLVSPLAVAAKVIAQPLRIEADTFTGATLPLKLVNDADQPLQVSARFRASDQLRPDPYAIEETIQPNSVEVIDLKLEPRRPLPTLEVHPLLLDVSLSYEMPNGQKLEMQRLQPVAIDQVSPSPKRTAPLVVDGKLDEWDGLPHICERPVQVLGQKDSWQEPGDASFRFATAHDDQYLYIAIRAKDERVLPMQGQVWSQDSLEVRLDARPDPVRSESRGQNEIQDEMGDFLLIATAPGKSAGQTYVFGRDDGRLLKDIQVATVFTAAGYACEIAIPVSYLNEVQKEPWKAFRMNIAQNDRDDPAGPHAQINWRPDWRTDESYVGSGTFVKR